MKTPTIIGVLLVIVGVIFLVLGGISYTTTHTAAKVGPLAITTQEKKTFPISPLAGGAMVAGGVTLLIVGSMRRAA